MRRGRREGRANRLRCRRRALPMANGKRLRDEESSTPPHGLPHVCRESFRGRYFSPSPPFFRSCLQRVFTVLQFLVQR